VCGKATGSAVWTGSRDGLGWSKKKQGGAWVGRLGLKGRAEWAGSKEREREPQGGCGPKCKRAAKTILGFFQGLEFKSRVLNKDF
jgi:hypothetical protein